MATKHRRLISTTALSTRQEIDDEQTPRDTQAQNGGVERSGGRCDQGSVRGSAYRSESPTRPGAQTSVFGRVLSAEAVLRDTECVANAVCSQELTRVIWWATKGAISTACGSRSKEYEFFDLETKHQQPAGGNRRVHAGGPCSPVHTRHGGPRILDRRRRRCALNYPNTRERNRTSSPFLLFPLARK